MIKDYINLPEEIEEVGFLHPVSIFEWEEFHTLARKFLLYSYDYLNYRLKQPELKMFDFLILTILSSEDSEKRVYDMLELQRLLQIVFKDTIQCLFDKKKNEWVFKVGEKGFVTCQNFDRIKEVIMRQNLLYEPIVVEDENTQTFINQHFERLNATGEESDLESMLAYVSNIKGISPETFKTYSYYQLRVDFEMAQKIENNLYIHMYRTQGAKGEPINITSKLNVHKSPYSLDNIFNKVDEQKEQELQKMMAGF